MTRLEISQEKKGFKWSTITYRIAPAMYARSPAAPEALKSFKVLQFPDISNLRTLKGTKFHQLVINTGIPQYVKEKQNNYTKYKEEMTGRGQKDPLHEGILIFGKVQVINKVKWSFSGQ